MQIVLGPQVPSIDWLPKQRVLFKGPQTAPESVWVRLQNILFYDNPKNK